MRAGLRPLLAGSTALLCACVPPPPQPGPAGQDASVLRLVALVDEHRARVGCPPLVWSPELAEVAAGHSRDMAERGYYGHVDPEGRGLVERLEAAGIAWRRTGENIARTPYGAAQAFAMWRDSPPHRRNLDECAFRSHGAGRTGELWTHVFLQPVP